MSQWKSAAATYLLTFTCLMMGIYHHVIIHTHQNKQTKKNPPKQNNGSYEFTSYLCVKAERRELN